MATAFANADANADGRISMEDRLWWVWLWFGWHMVALDSLVWGQNMQKTSKNTSNPVAPISTNIQNGVLMLKTTCSNSCSLIVLCKTTTSWSFKCQDTHTHNTKKKGRLDQQLKFSITGHYGMSVATARSLNGSLEPTQTLTERCCATFLTRWIATRRQVKLTRINMNPTWYPWLLHIWFTCLLLNKIIWHHVALTIWINMRNVAMAHQIFFSKVVG